MPDADWKPLFARLGEEDPVVLDELHDGIPEWLRESVWSWLNNNYVSPFYNTRSGGYHDPNTERIRKIERIARISCGWTGNEIDYRSRCDGRDRLRATLYKDARAFLIAIDLGLTEFRERDSAPAKLDEILREGSSSWCVARLDSGTGFGLGRRLDGTVQKAAEALVANGSRAGALLAEAWNNTFTLEPNPTAGYRAAVRAVEASAATHICPDDPRPSLGKMIPALRAKPDKWAITLRRDTAVEPVEVVASMMQLLWTNEYSRHVEADESVPLHISQSEAEAAVALSLTLVNWFCSGVVVLKE